MAEETNPIGRIRDKIGATFTIDGDDGNVYRAPYDSQYEVGQRVYYRVTGTDTAVITGRA